MKRLAITAAILCAFAGCSEGGDNNSSNASNASGTAGGAVGVKRFVNNPNNNFSASMKEKYVDFAFTYPEGWTDKIAPDAGNFVQVYAPERGGLEPFSFALGNATGSGNAQTDRALMDSLVPQFERQFGSSIQDFAVRARGERQLGRYTAHGFDFTGRAPGPDGDPVDLSGRVDIILPPGQQRGVTAISLAYDRGSGAPPPAAIAQLEPFRMIYESLRIGPDSR